MSFLTESQVAYIRRDLCEQGITNASLCEDLVDHICCLLENEGIDKCDFELKYREIIKQFSKNSVTEIQEETELLLTYPNFYTMKNVMIKSGIAAAILIVIGSTFKLAHLPGASAAFILATLLFSFVFLPIFFVVESAKSSLRGTKWLIGLGALFGILFCLSTCFKVMHWPGANLLWRLALGELIFLFLPVYFMTNYKKVETRSTTLITSIMILMIGGMLFMLTNLKSSVRLDRAELSNFGMLKEVSNQTIARNDTLHDLSSYKTNALQAIDELKLTIIKNTSQLENRYLTENECFEWYNKNYEVVRAACFNTKNNPKDALLKIKSSLQAINQLVPKSFDLTDRTFHEERISWEYDLFYDLPLATVLNTLNLLKVKVNQL
jgi:hypothetical protein